MHRRKYLPCLGVQRRKLLALSGTQARAQLGKWVGDRGPRQAERNPVHGSEDAW